MDSWKRPRRRPRRPRRGRAARASKQTAASSCATAAFAVSRSKLPAGWRRTQMCYFGPGPVIRASSPRQQWQEEEGIIATYAAAVSRAQPQGTTAQATRLRRAYAYDVCQASSHRLQRAQCLQLQAPAGSTCKRQAGNSRACATFLMESVCLWR